MKCLSIGRIDRMISLPKEVLQHFSGLVNFRINACPDLQSLELPSFHGEISVPEALLQCWRSSLSSLRALAICDCPELTSLPKEIYSLQKLETLYLSGFQLTDEDRAKIAWLPDINLTMDSLADDEV